MGGEQAFAELLLDYLIFTLDTHTFSCLYMLLCRSRLHTLLRTVLVKRGFLGHFLQYTSVFCFMKCCCFLKGSFRTPFCHIQPSNSTLSFPISVEENQSTLSSLYSEGIWRQHVVNQALILLLREPQQRYTIHNNLTSHLSIIKCPLKTLRLPNRSSKLAALPSLFALHFNFCVFKQIFLH